MTEEENKILEHIEQNKGMCHLLRCKGCLLKSSCAKDGFSLYTVSKHRLKQIEIIRKIERIKKLIKG